MQIIIESIIKETTIKSKSFEYKTKIIEGTLNDNNILDADVVVPLKNLSNFWISFDLPLINCEIELNLSCSRYRIISEISRTPAVAANPPVPTLEPTQKI